MLQKKLYTYTQISRVIFLAIVYYLTAEISRHVASTPQNVTPVWPPDGIAVGAMLLFGRSLWSGVLLGSFLANIWAFVDRTNLFLLLISVLQVLGIAVGTTLGTLLGTYLLEKSIKKRYPFERVNDVFKFLILACMTGPIVNATVGVTCLALSTKIPWTAYGKVWLTWWISNVSGIFIVTPVLLSWGKLIRNHQDYILRWCHQGINSQSRFHLSSLQNQIAKVNILRVWLTIEALLLLVLIFVVGQFTFGQGYALKYMLIPILIWSAFRVGQPATTLLTFIVAAIAVISTIKGHVKVVHSDMQESLILMQSFIGIIMLTTLVLTAAIAERISAESKLRLAFAELAKTNETLEIRVWQRTEELSEKNIALEQTLQTLKQAQVQMLQTEKMSALGQMVAGVAHEINNPVTFIHGNLTHLTQHTQDLLRLLQSYRQNFPHPPQVLQAQLDEIEPDFINEDLTKILQSMKVGTERINSIVLSLRNFSRLDEAEFKAVDIHEGIDNTFVILQHRLQARANRPEIQVIKTYSQLPLVECYAGQINQVFMNILNNAIDALEESNQKRSFQEISVNPNTILVHTEMIDANWVVVAISDNGCGISEELQSKIFDPFFTTKDIGKGAGLGLYVSYQIVTEKHGGKLWCDSTLGQGTKFIIELPVVV